MKSIRAFHRIPRLFLATIAATLVLAIGQPAPAASFGGPFQIRSVIVGGFGAHVEVTPKPSECTSNWEGTQFVVLRERADYKDFLAALLSAQAQAKPIMLWHSPQGNGTCGFGNQLMIDAIQIRLGS